MNISLYFIGKNLLENCFEDKNHDNGSSIDERTVTTTDGQESCKLALRSHAHFPNKTYFTTIICLHCISLHNIICTVSRHNFMFINVITVWHKFQGL